MSKVAIFVTGILFSLFGLIIFIPNSNASGPEAYEEFYWAFGGCLLSLTGILVSIVALLWPSKPIDFESGAIENGDSNPTQDLADR